MSIEQFSHEEIGPHAERFHLNGRILYLTENPELLKRQLAGEDFSDIPTEQLLSGVSTDEIIPNRVCLRYTGHKLELLGSNVLTGLRDNLVAPDAIANGGFQVVVAGPSFGRGSSRYHAPLALLEAGINVVVAKTERIFQENCVNAGIYPLAPDTDAFLKLTREGSITLDEMRENLSPVSRDIMKAGNLVRYLQRLENGEFSYPQGSNEPRPMSMIEKIISRKVFRNNTDVGVSYVRPGEEYIVQPDTYYGYELQTTVVRKALEQEFGINTNVRHPQKAYLFNDHTALIQTTEAAQTQQREQKIFADKHGIINFENDENGANAICHTKILEDFALPGQLILGNDSHTDTLGAVNALAIGKGAADLAGALAFDKMVIKVPETIRISITGKLTNGATMKDFMLYLGALPQFKEDRIASGRVLEFGGNALHDIPLDEQLKLTNMAIELQAFTGIVEPNTQMFKYLKEKRGIDLMEFTDLMVISDGEAEYFDVLPFDLSTIEPMVATPGDTQNGVPLSEVTRQKIKVQKAYIGSCTHGTVEDLRQAAEVLEGRKIADGVKLYVQASSLGNLREAEEKGYIKTLLDSGAKLLPIGCGACMNAGPGSTEEGEVGIFATNRNFPGRTGKGETYLSNAKVAAASAIVGIICGPDDLDTNL